MASTSAPSSTTRQPPWTPPQRSPDVRLPPLKVYNSLTRSKDDFVPAHDKKVSWYTCGPTVYDDAHLGHARNYVSIDILRRIMRDYFGFDVNFVMNITDVDDKIILRGRQQHFLAQFKQQHPPAPDATADEPVLATARAAFAYYIQKNLPLLPKDTAPDQLSTEVDKVYKRVLDGLALSDAPDAVPGDDEAKLQNHLKTAAAAADALRSPGKLSHFYTRTDDLLLPYLDFLHGTSIDANDHAIFTKLTRDFETRFLEDMQNLNVLGADKITRVTEYMPEIIRFVEKIVANGFAYATSDGSVYFDIEAFEKAGHSYARLEPWNRNNQALQADGEGSLSKTTLKRGESHFALWKASKPGEPSWPSPWGPGRPGWHIECSAMASEVLGKVIDVHSGGGDLRFPHHDNELAQSEAYWTAGGNPVQWTNYFLHTGHLSIRGLKMSKSLKNFTTIRSAIQTGAWDPRSLRICFLLGSWQDGIEITEDILKATTSWESKLNNFFLKSVQAARDLAASDKADGAEEPSAVDKTLLDALEKAKTDLDAALCDSFNTPAAMRVISELVSEYNLAQRVSDQTLVSIAQWITRIVTIFGLDSTADLDDAKRVAWSGIEIPAAAQPYVYPASQVRDKIRTLARSSPPDYASIGSLASETKSTLAQQTGKGDDVAAKPYREVAEQFLDETSQYAKEEKPAKELFALCDQLRDVHLWNLGIYLEDWDPPLPATVRPIDRSLREARAAEAKKEEAKRQRVAAEAAKQRALDEKAMVNPLEMFRTSEFSEWDKDGVPLREASGEELTKSKRKKLLKQWEQQKKLHEGWKSKQAAQTAK